MNDYVVTYDSRTFEVIKVVKGTRFDASIPLTSHLHQLKVPMAATANDARDYAVTVAKQLAGRR